MNNNWYKKEKPLLGLTGLGGGVDGLAVVGAATKTYVDDVFSTYVKSFYGSTNIVNNIDLAGEGGLVWTKIRNNTDSHYLADTVNGVNKTLMSNVDNALANNSYAISAFNNNGFTYNDGYGGAKDYATWTFRKAPGFFDIVTYTGNGSSNHQISHNLGSVPGCIMVKCTSESQDWMVYHVGTTDSAGPGGAFLRLNTTAAQQGSSGGFQNATATSSIFTLGDFDIGNKNNATYVAYLFAGGESTASGARSVEFDGNDSVDIPSSTDFDFGSGDFTVEAWVKTTASGERCIVNRSNAHAGSDSAFIMYIMSSGKPYFGITENTGWDYYVEGTTNIRNGAWNHVAATRDGNYLKMYVNGTLEGITSWSGSIPTSSRVVNIGVQDTGIHMDGRISNVRIVKGTAVYTSSFIPPIEPLTDITNTKLLCCQNSQPAYVTVAPAPATANGNPTVSDSISPFDDPAAHIFGKSGSENLIKCGSYVGNGSATHFKIDLGFEPQWLMIKRIDGGTSQWTMADMMRGTPADDGDSSQDGSFLWANQDWAEATDRPFTTHSTGFGLKNTSSSINASGDTYVYIAIRRPDGYVGKPATAGTGVFSIATGTNNTNPGFVSGFPVDFSLRKVYASSTDWFAASRLTGPDYLRPNTTDYQASNSNQTFDFQNGMGEWGGDLTTYMSWQWKRHAGFDVTMHNVAAASGTGTIRHNLGVVPEMIWGKSRDNADSWAVYHKGMNGGTNPQDYYDALNSDNGMQTLSDFWGSSGPTATDFTIAQTYRATGNHIYMLFASVTGISKVGYYSGSNSSQTITTGFQPRMVIIKSTSSSRNWVLFDTTRGWASGSNDSELNLNKTAAAGSSYDFGGPISTGFTVNYFGGSDDVNVSGHTYIYYAHA